MQHIGPVQPKLSTGEKTLDISKKEILVLLQNKKLGLERIAANYLEARKIAAEFGGLPSNRLHERYLSSWDRDLWKSLSQLYQVADRQGAWARELLVYPPARSHYGNPNYPGTFERGLDIIDSSHGSGLASWVLPWSELVRLVDPDQILIIVIQKEKLLYYSILVLIQKLFKLRNIPTCLKEELGRCQLALTKIFQEVLEN